MHFVIIMGVFKLNAGFSFKQYVAFNEKLRVVLEEDKALFGRVLPTVLNSIELVD
jgi:hypothetical protein